MQKILIDTCIVIAAIDKNSLDHVTAHKLLEWAEKEKIMFSIPAHAVFEIWCTGKRLAKIDKTFQGGAINNKFNYPIDVLYIDEVFLKKYGNVELKHIKAGDHIFLVVAKLDNYPLITLDSKMIKVAKAEGIEVYTPDEFIKFWQSTVNAKG